jgi:PAS domain S-box-containing protein
VSTQLVLAGDSTSLLLTIVDAAIAITAADMGTIQLLDRGAGELKIVASRCLDRPFLEFFNTVHAGQGTHGRAAQKGERVVVEDVATSPVFAGTPLLEVHLASGIRAVQSTPLTDRSGQLVGVLSTHYRTPRRPADRDLGVLDLLARQVADWIERTQAEEALRESEERFRGTFENAAVGIAHADANGRFLRVNEKYCEIVGYSRAELLTRSFRDITHTAELPANIAQYNRLMRGELPSFAIEKRYVRKDGSLVWVDVTVSLQRDATGKPADSIAIAEDISERKAVEEAPRRERPSRPGGAGLEHRHLGSGDAGRLSRAQPCPVHQLLGAPRLRPRRVPEGRGGSDGEDAPRRPGADQARRVGVPGRQDQGVRNRESDPAQGRVVPLDALARRGPA